MQLRQGWFISCLLHGLMLVSLLTLSRLSPMPALNESFRWDVMLVESTQTTQKPAQTAGATEQTASYQTERVPMPARAVRTTQHAVASTERIVPIKPPIAEPLAPTSQPSIVSSTTLQKEPATASVSGNPNTDQSQVSDPQLQQAETPTTSTTTEPSATQTATAISTEASSPVTETAQPSSPPVMATAPTAVSTQRPDYGWLQQAIFKRLDELKRSSRPSLDQSQPIKVLVKAVVSREGTLLDSSVARSSGLDHIDQEAMALVQRAFPMQLDRTLDRQQIVMRIPITYSHE